MTDKTLSFGARAQSHQFTQKNARSQAGWIKRRARRLAQAFAITRREALLNACTDWCFFNIGARGTANV